MEATRTGAMPDQAKAAVACAFAAALVSVVGTFGVFAGGMAPGVFASGLALIIMWGAILPLLVLLVVGGCLVAMRKPVGIILVAIGAGLALLGELQTLGGLFFFSPGGMLVASRLGLAVVEVAAATGALVLVLGTPVRQWMRDETAMPGPPGWRVVRP